MKSNRAIAIIVSLIVLALVVMVAQLWWVNEPTHQGKTVSVWFKEYANTPNAPMRPPLVLSSNELGILTRAISNRASAITLWWLTNQFVAQRPVVPPPRQAAAEALQALGSNAVPCLARHIHFGHWERTYARAVTNLPAFVQRRLPNPADKYRYRIAAMQALNLLNHPGPYATPALIEVLDQGDPSLRWSALTALRKIHADAGSMSDLLLKLGQQKRYAEMLEIARAIRWEGGAVARVFGEMLQSTNTGLHRETISLLEAAGSRAAPALDSILLALENEDPEVRYLAARAVEKIGEDAPQLRPRIEPALQGRLHDESDMVRNVAQRALGRIAPTAATAVKPERIVDNPRHDGKTVEQWFQDYIASRETRIPANASPVMNGEFLPRTPVRDQPDPAWTAFQALGEKAIPDLLRHLNASGELATSEPAQLAQSQAIDLIHRLGPVARSAAPALLTLLKRVEESEAEAVCAAIARVRPEPQLLNQFLLAMGKEQRDADMLYYARRLGWSGPDVARRLGAMLQSRDREEAHGAIALLEAAGPDAHAAIELIILALGHRDQEIRYLAARSLARLSVNSPTARKALQGIADDSDGMVRTVARKAIAAQAETLSPDR